jgi:UDP-glucuronate 4-epimerase
MNRKKRILITGAAGFIGSNLTNSLLQRDDLQVIGLDNFDDFYSREQKEKNMSSFISNDDFSFIEGDIRNMNDLLALSDIDVIVHLAAKAGVRPSIQDPILYQEVNVSGTQNLLEFARQRNIKQFVFASSSSVYGINENVPWQEDEKLMPISPYASTKLSCEMLGHVYNHLYGIRFLALRFLPSTDRLSVLTWLFINFSILFPKDKQFLFLGMAQPAETILLWKIPFRVLRQL